MKAIKVNADYESVLFQNKPLPIINEALEFLALFLTDRPLLTKKKYDDYYLGYIEEKTGIRPSFKSEGPFENWWGPLIDIPLEKQLNSKIMSAELSLQRGFCKDTYIVDSLKDLPALKGKTFLGKNPYGMSGQNFCMVEEGRLELLEQLLKQGKAIVEPFFNRVHDFSHYVFPNRVKICYQNIVDQKFQYKGSIFQDYTQPTIENLSFYKDISQDRWNEFIKKIEIIEQHYRHDSLPCGFSIDSFVYDDQGLQIRTLSEVNYRRTMGQTAFELALKFGGLRKWNALILTKSLGIDFKSLREKISDIEWNNNLSRGVVILSPEKVRYDMFFMSALNQKEGAKLIEEFQDCVNIKVL